MSPPTSRCRRCRAPVRWCVTPKGRPIPINLSPDTAKGNVRVDFSPDPSASPLATVLTDEERTAARAARMPLYLTHFATCPKAGEFRRR